MQMRIHRDKSIKRVGQQSADDRLADGFPSPEGDVLAHIRQVGCDQTQIGHAPVAQRRRREEQLGQFGIRAIQRSINCDVPSAGQNTHAAFIIRKCMHLDAVAWNAKAVGQAQRCFGAVVERQKSLRSKGHVV